MKAHWWSCLFGLLWVNAEGARWTASQRPASTLRVEINSSLEISCSTSLPNTLGLTLYRSFKASTKIVYLSLDKSGILKQTPDTDFIDRVRVTRERSDSEYEVTLQLSKLKEDDTDLYYCTWTYLDVHSVKHLKSNGTVVIVGEKRPEARCQILTLDLVLVCGGITAFVLILCFSAVSFWRGRRGQIKRSFRPTAPPRLERPHRHRSCSCNSHPPQIESYLVTSLQSAYFNR
ncbi:uncharacterized protein LOC105353787 [Oryzias latipes]|uniref:uncharacterized protein LOC105353787 n=1 Tax=Oryzias latipes TaxID=8090 RepID=UPI0005CBF872|nr:uncharacterized protein LOC105353787 [Oryzias latipes]